MSTTRITLRVPDEVVERIDRNAEQTGETRTERMLRSLPAYYGDDWGAQPDATVPATSTRVIALRIDDKVLERIDAAVLRNGTARADYILQWQPEYYDRRTLEAELDDPISARELAAVNHIS